MRSYFRLLPLTMFCALMLMAVKLGQAMESGESLWDKFVIGAVAAQEPAPQAQSASTDKKAEENTSAETPVENGAAPTEQKAEASAAESKEAKPAETAPQTAKEGVTPSESGKDVKAADASKEKTDAKDGAAPKEGEEAAKKEDDTFLTPIFAGSKKEYKAEDLIGNQLGGTRPDDRRFSPVELQLLQQLSDRRIKLDEREKSVEMKESLLNQAEVRVNEKFEEMTSLRSELAELIRRYNEIEDTKVRSLVKIYENMKPKDAARIFDEVEMPILLMVIDQMSEKRAAPILANMDSKKAKQITVELAEQRRLQDNEIASQRAAEQAASPNATKPAPKPAANP